MSIEIGDAVLRFLGDTTNMDAAFASVGSKAEKGLQPASDAIDGVEDGFKSAGKAGDEAADKIEDAGKRSTSSMREARGEAALLGEEFGIRLPRHVRNFVAELPGVGTALSAAFSATAILFIIQALFQAEEKLRAFLSHKAEHEAQQKLLEDQAKAISDINKEAEKAATEMDKLTKTPIELHTAKIAALTAQYENLYRATYASSGVLAAEGKQLENEIALETKLLEIEKQKEADKANADKLKSLREEIELRKQLGDVQVLYAEAVHGLSKENADEARYQISLKALRSLAAAEKEYGKDNEDTIKKTYAEIEQATVEHTLKTTEEFNKQREALEKTLDAMQKDVKASDGVEIVPPVNVQHILQGIAAVKSLGVTLKTDLVQAYNEARQAEVAFAESGIKDAVAAHAIAQKVNEAKAALDAYGHSLDTLKTKTETTFKGFQQDLKQGADATHELSDLGVTAFNQLSKGMEAALASAILASGSFGKAMEKATAQALASLAAQAIVKALFYTAEGFAALAGFEAGPAAEYFQAAGLMAAVGAAAGLAGHAIAGAGGGSRTPSNFQGFSGGSDTSGSGQRGGVSVKAFADGGLVTGPTLALAGESGTEAVMPLTHPDSLAAIAQALAPHVAAAIGSGSGGHHMHVNVQGLVSDDKLINIMKKMTKMVNRGQATLQASHALVINNRGGGGK